MHGDQVMMNKSMKWYCFLPILVASAILLACGCSERTSNGAGQNVEGDKEESYQTNSVDYFLSPHDLDQFKGAHKDEIFRVTNWAGNLEIMEVVNGQEVLIVRYGINGGPYGDDPNGSTIWAIFIDGQFSKFVDPPSAPYPSPIFPIQEGKIIPIEEALALTEVTRSQIPPPTVEKDPTSSRFDPGLTAAWLAASSAVNARIEKDRETNTRLRDQFNALRLSVGMSREQVNQLFKSNPLRTGDVGSCEFEVYGAGVDLGITQFLAYSNIFLVYDKDRLIAIRSFPGGSRWQDSVDRIVTSNYWQFISPLDGDN